MRFFDPGILWNQKKKDEVCRRLSHPKRFDFFGDLCKRFPYHDLNSARWVPGFGWGKIGWKLAIFPMKVGKSEHGNFQPIL